VSFSLFVDFVWTRLETCNDEYVRTTARPGGGGRVFTFTFIHSFTDPLSVKTGLDIELVMIEAGLQHAIKSMQYNTTVVEN
jgi:hypothetical protein